MRLLDLLYRFLSANNGQTIEQSIFCAGECLAHFAEIVTPEIEEVAEMFLRAAIKNPYLLGVAEASAKDVAEWAVAKAVQYQERIRGEK